MCSNYPGIKLEPGLGTREDKIEHLSSYPHVVHTTAKQVISRRRKNENVFKMSKDEKCTCKAFKTIGFHCQTCKFVGFLLSSSSWLLKLPTIKSAYRPCSMIIFPHSTNQINFSYSKYKKDDDLSLISLSTLKPSCPFVRNNKKKQKAEEKTL